MFFPAPLSKNYSSIPHEQRIELDKCSGFYQDACYIGVAEKYKNEAICEITNAKGNCYRVVAEAKGDPSLCDKAEDISDDCYYGIALSKNDPYLCRKAKTKTEKCFYEMARNDYNADMCKYITDNEYLSNCNQWFGLDKRQTLNDQFACKIVDGFSMTELINNNLPDSIEFWTQATCPNAGSVPYQEPDGYELRACETSTSFGGHCGCASCTMSKIELARIPGANCGPLADKPADSTWMNKDRCSRGIPSPLGGGTSASDPWHWTCTEPTTGESVNCSAPLRLAY